MNSNLIVFEGIDNSGKTSLSKRVCEMLLSGTGMQGGLRYSGSDQTSWVWAKEPTFTTEEADRLNDPALKVDENAREVLFLESRLRQQQLYHSGNTILDRYLWTGMAYAKVFSPSVFGFAKEMYQNFNIFKKPLVTVFVDTPVSICQEREPSLSLERLNNIREAYLSVMPLVHTDIIMASGDSDIETTSQIIYAQILPYLGGIL